MPSDINVHPPQQKETYSIKPVTNPSDLNAIISLFKAYTAWLDLDLSFQNYASELASLPGKYAPPSGMLLLAHSSSSSSPTTDAIPIGCVALRPMSEPGVCEMKRLYVAPEGRGSGLGSRLVAEVLRAAKRIGYQRMRLDTLPRMRSAIKMYEGVGFRQIEPYYDTPLEGTLFLELDLTTWKDEDVTS